MERHVQPCDAHITQSQRDEKRICYYRPHFLMIQYDVEHDIISEQCDDDGDDVGKKEWYFIQDIRCLRYVGEIGQQLQKANSTGNSEFLNSAL